MCVRIVPIVINISFKTNEELMIIFLPIAIPMNTFFVYNISIFRNIRLHNINVLIHYRNTFDWWFKCFRCRVFSNLNRITIGTNAMKTFEVNAYTLNSNLLSISCSNVATCSSIILYVHTVVTAGLLSRYVILYRN